MADSGQTGVWLREGDGWVVGLGSTRVFLRDSKGLRHLGHLMERPGTEVSALELVALAEGHGRGAAPAAADDLTAGQGDAGPLLDDVAKQQYRRRLEELAAQMDAADRAGDRAGAERLAQEFEFLTKELRSATGLGGRDRRAGSDLERARVNVTRSIKSALQRVEQADAALGEHLRDSVRTGTFCVYAPVPGRTVAWGSGAASPRPVAAAAPITVMFCDLEDSTALMERLGETAWLQLMGVHNEVIRAQVAEHGGREVKTTGDGFMLTFPDAREALWCAADVQRELAAHAERRPDQPLRVRMGLHTGEAVEESDDVFGVTVVTAARLSQAAAGGQVLVSETVRDAAGGELGELALGPPRTLQLRGLRGAHRAYELLWHGDAGTPAAGAAAAASAAQPVPEALSERDAERDALRAALTSAAAGRGRIIVLEGPAGIGKTALVTHATEIAQQEGARVLRARGSEIERASPFGVVRRLFEPALHATGDDQRAALLRGAVSPAARMLGMAGDRDEAAAPHDVLHVVNGLAWLTAGLATGGPLLIVVDDLQWADEPSLAWVEFMAGRIADLPVVLVVTARSPAGDAADAALARMSGAPAVTVLSPAPLSEEAVAGIVRAIWPEADGAFCRACHAASDGNPFYLREIAGAARTAGVEPTEAGARRLRDVTPDSVARMVLGRLRPLGPDALALARACAVLGVETDIALAGAVAGLDSDEAYAAADALGAATILRSDETLGFAHPLVAAVVERDIPPGERSRLHERAATRLTSRGSPPAEVALHLLRARPSGSAATLRTLRAAARQAMRDGAPESAVRFLERSLREPPDAAELPAVLLELGRALQDAGRPDEARRQLDRAVELAEEPRLRAEAVLAASRHWEDPKTDIVARLDETIAALPEDERELRFALEARALGVLGELIFHTPSPDVTRDHDKRMARVVAEAGGGTPGERELLAISAVHKAIRAGIGAREAKAVALRTLDDGQLMLRLAEGAWDCDSAIEVLILADAFEEADRHAREAERQARARGAVTGEAYACMLRALIAFHRGALLEAESVLRSVFAVTRGLGEQPYIEYMAQQIRACVAIERGDPSGAARACEELSRTAVSPMGPPHSLGRVLAARGEHGLAVAQLQAAYDMQRAAGLWRTMVTGSARTDLALSLVALGRTEEARELAAAEVETARRFGAAGALGLALRVQARAEGGAREVELLEEADAVLSSSLALLARGYVLCDLGAARRASGEQDVARHTLRQSLELAVRCGARRLIDQVTGELALAGARPRRIELAGRELLSPTESRIAELAAEGASDLEIAQALFLSPRSVQDGLAAAVGKLGVGSRAELAGAMGLAPVAA